MGAYGDDHVVRGQRPLVHRRPVNEPVQESPPFGAGGEPSGYSDVSSSFMVSPRPLTPPRLGLTCKSEPHKSLMS